MARDLPMRALGGHGIRPVFLALTSTWIGSFKVKICFFTGQVYGERNISLSWKRLFTFLRNFQEFLLVRVHNLISEISPLQETCIAPTRTQRNSVCSASTGTRSWVFNLIPTSKEVQNKSASPWPPAAELRRISGLTPPPRQAKMKMPRFICNGLIWTTRCWRNSGWLGLLATQLFVGNPGK